MLGKKAPHVKPFKMQTMYRSFSRYDSQQDWVTCALCKNKEQAIIWTRRRGDATLIQLSTTDYCHLRHIRRLWRLDKGVKDTAGSSGRQRSIWWSLAISMEINWLYTAAWRRAYGRGSHRSKDCSHVPLIPHISTRCAQKSFTSCGETHSGWLSLEII